MPEQLTLYSARICPWAQRATREQVDITLKESGLSYERFEVDLLNKPEWYAPKVNPVSKVPALAYGGPKVSPDQPSPESQKLAESLVLIEFIADLVESLRPKDPVIKAKARFFVETVTAKLPPAWYGAATRGESLDNVLAAIDVLQSLLPAEGYAVGEWSIADAAVTPFLARIDLALKNDLGAYDEGLGRKAWNTLHTDPKFERFRKYFADVRARKSFQETFDTEHILTNYQKRFSELREKRLGAGV
ncbi:hypothetical protein P691DRAFT_730207 [Macrolepiota fuliginosa MF-IS2]|uniref:GST N-terminal domain-containing protein n=1 Tax=Macrolepiota fuliginosa MF-IS2 TaxID=1400762 RepID=A0A9P6C3X1_9AGAR|nr:hypothetical protein P691DRAFT_730207 [Macrolepiota fuliginosa MF-IS2]